MKFQHLTPLPKICSTLCGHFSGLGGAGVRTKQPLRTIPCSVFLLRDAELRPFSSEMTLTVYFC